MWLFKADGFKNWRPTYPWLEWCHFRAWWVSSFFNLVFDIQMYLFRAFDTYVVKVLEGHPKGKCWKLKHHTTLCPIASSDQHMWLLCLLKHGCIWSAAKLRCKCKCIYFTLLWTFMIKHAYLSFANTYFSFYHGRTTKMLSLMCKVLASSTLERD
jgi:hypothetical protein